MLTDWKLYAVLAVALCALGWYLLRSGDPYGDCLWAFADHPMSRQAICERYR